MIDTYNGGIAELLFISSLLSNLVPIELLRFVRVQSLSQFGNNRAVLTSANVKHVTTRT